MTNHPKCYVLKRCDNTISVVQLSSTAPHYERAIAAQIREWCEMTGDVIIAGPLPALAVLEYRAEVEREAVEVQAWKAAQRLNLRAAVRDAVARHRARRLNEIAKNPDPRD
jgi:hypothetical protein